MDLKQPITLKPANKKIAYPTKTTINLVSADQARGNLFMQLLLFAVVLALIGIFAKFAVVDPLSRSMESNSQLSAANAQLAVLKQENASYAELNEKYERYVVTGLTAEEQNLTNRNTVLDLLEQKVMGVGYLSTLKVADNVATFTCLDIDLNRVSALVESLETDDRVAHVTVSTAQGEGDVSTSATFQVTFKGAMDSSGDGTQSNAAFQATGTEAGK